MAKLSKTEVMRAVKAEIERADSFMDDRISQERAICYDYYYGKPLGTEVEGRSQVVSGDVSQVVDSALPSLLKIFVSGDKAVEFLPRGPEDVKAAEQATLGCNYVFYTQNNGYALAHDFLKDGLLQKTGVFKWVWDECKTISEKRYQKLDTMELMQLSQQEGVEIIEHSEAPAVDEMGMPAVDPITQLPAVTHDVLVRVTKPKNQIKITVPPPEEILISPDSLTLDVMSMPFIAHQVYVTASDLREMGVSQSVIDSLPSEDGGAHDDEEKQSRDERNNVTSLVLGSDGSVDPSRKVYEYTESWIRLDADGDGVSELVRVCSVGDVLIEGPEPVDHIPLAIWTPKVMPHEVVGMSLAEEVVDIQLLKSTLWRGALDNLYLSIAPRMFAKGDVNLDDVLTVKPGGVIRGGPDAELMPIVVPDMMGPAFQMLEYADQEEEVRTGISRLFQGIDPSAINKTATGVNALINQANSRVELMARNAAEFGFKPLFRGIMYLLAKHQSDALMVRLTNNFVPIDPETWSKEYDMSCNVGLGMGTKEQQLMQLQMLSQDMAMIAQSPFAQQLLDAKKVFNLEQKKAELAGFKDVTIFLNDPEGQPPPQPQKPPEIQKAEMEIQADAQKFQAQAQLDQQNKQVDMQAQAAQAQMDAQLEREKMAMQAQLEEFKAIKQAELEQFKIEKQAELERYKAELNAQVQRETAQLSAHSTVKAAYAAANTEDPEDEGVKTEKAREKAENRQLLEGIAQLIAQSNRPREIVRGKDGRAIGVRPV